MHADGRAASGAIIPVIDLGAYPAGVRGSPEAPPDALRRALESIGFFIIVNQGFPRELIADNIECCS